MKLQIQNGDIMSPNIEADVLIFPANLKAKVGGSLDSKVYTAAGWDKLLAVRQKIGELKYGEACLTESFDFKQYNYLIHAVTPKYQQEDSMRLLEQCYLRAFELAEERQASHVVSALLGAGACKFPYAAAISTAEYAGKKYQKMHPDSCIQTVTVVSYSNESQYQLFIRCTDCLKELYWLLPQFQDGTELIHDDSYIGNIVAFVSRKLKKYTEDEIESWRRKYKEQMDKETADLKKSDAEFREQVYHEIFEEAWGKLHTTTADFAAKIYVSGGGTISQFRHANPLKCEDLKKIKNAVSFWRTKINVIKLALGLELPPEKFCRFLWSREHAFPTDTLDETILNDYVRTGLYRDALEDFEEEFKSPRMTTKEKQEENER